MEIVNKLYWYCMPVFCFFTNSMFTLKSFPPKPAKTAKYTTVNLVFKFYYLDFFLQNFQ